MFFRIFAAYIQIWNSRFGREIAILEPAQSVFNEVRGILQTMYATF
jgi:hypothetical protein